MEYSKTEKTECSGDIHKGKSLDIGKKTEYRGAVSW